MRFIAALALVPLVLQATGMQAAGVPTIEAGRGTEGLAPVHLQLTNRGARVLDCQIQLAHWFSDRLATVAPGESIERVFWRDPRTGSVALLNERGDAMPVEALWCGVAGQAYRTRAQIPLERLRSEVAPALTCRDDPVRVVCD